MRKICYHIACSIDGYIAKENGDFSPFLMEGEHVQDFMESLFHYDTVLMGTNTYKIGLQHGLELGQPAYKDLTHYIFTNSIEFDNSDSVIRAPKNQLQFIQELKDQSGKDIWLCGGATLAQMLLEYDLIDELILKINPILIGKGIQLFKSNTLTKNLKLKHTKVYSNGVILCHYGC